MVIVAGDRHPPLSVTLPTSPTLVGATVRLRMRLRGATAAVLDTVVTGVNTETGALSRTWGAGETSTPGTYELEWLITYADATTQTRPNGAPDALVIRRRIEPAA